MPKNRSWLSLVMVLGALGLAAGCDPNSGGAVVAPPPADAAATNPAGADAAGKKKIQSVGEVPSVMPTRND